MPRMHSDREMFTNCQEGKRRKEMQMKKWMRKFAKRSTEQSKKEWGDFYAKEEAKKNNKK
jgi:hypothetical protein